MRIQRAFKVYAGCGPGGNRLRRRHQPSSVLSIERGQFPLVLRHCLWPRRPPPRAQYFYSMRRNYPAQPVALGCLHTAATGKRTVARLTVKGANIGRR